MKPQASPSTPPSYTLEDDELYSVKWNSYSETLLRVFRKYLGVECMSDVTLSCDGGHSVRCHRILLAACSSYFEKIFTTHPPNTVIFFRHMKKWELDALVTFMYHGEVRVSRHKLTSLVKAAASLRIKGLAPDTDFEVEEDETAEDGDGESEGVEDEGLKYDLAQCLREDGEEDDDEGSSEKTSTDSTSTNSRSGYSTPRNGSSGHSTSVSTTSTPESLSPGRESPVKRRASTPSTPLRKVQRTSNCVTPESAPLSTRAPFTPEDRKKILDYERKAIQSWSQEERVKAGLDDIVDNGNSDDEPEPPEVPQGGIGNVKLVNHSVSYTSYFIPVSFFYSFKSFNY